RIWGVEVKYSSTPKLTRGTDSALEDVNPEKLFIVYSGTHDYPLDEAGRIEAVSLPSMMQRLIDQHL
ncbi:MAG: ATPase, partial [Bacteroidota bacterium]